MGFEKRMTEGVCCEESTSNRREWSTLAYVAGNARKIRTEN